MGWPRWGKLPPPATRGNMSGVRQGISQANVRVAGHQEENCGFPCVLRVWDDFPLVFIAFWEIVGEICSEIIGNFLEKCWTFFGLFLGPLGRALGPPRGPQMGPGTPGIDLKSKTKSKILAGSVNYF